MTQHPIDGTVKTSRQGKVVIECSPRDLDVTAAWYCGKVVTVGGADYNVLSVGRPFGTHGNIRVYLYTDAKPAQAAKTASRAQKAAQFDRDINEGGEGYNPYR